MLKFFVLLSVVLPLSCQANSVYFGKSSPTNFDFLDQRQLPSDFGKEEFSLEVWIKPDNSFPVGSVPRGTFDQLTNWSSADPAPYSTPGWWLQGNWLLDGHSRPEGFALNHTREGSFSLQLYGGGRVRWLFSDGSPEVPENGRTWAIQAYPADTVPSLLDGNWHQVICIRRWTEDGKAALELWVDGNLIAKQLISSRVNMRQFWDSVPHPKDPENLGGWSWGAEVMTAWGFYFTQYEDYKGHIDDIRFWNKALNKEEIFNLINRQPLNSTPGLLAWYDFSEGVGPVAADRFDKTGQRQLILYRMDSSWSVNGSKDKVN
ncbi:LamG-like jellyroll fold domain-containing protein [Rheinheimera fenheensis]|uniref:LamG-like jellyroll fold domain-containing protein n=1 Tax=Rheinheimera fenheensis TaxID=3152295 RepID=UPI00325DA569